MGFAPEDARVVHERDLDASAAQVGQDPRATLQVDPARHGGVDQPGLFGAGDHLQGEVGFPGDAVDEQGAVAGFPDRAGSHRPVVLDAEAHHVLMEGAEGLNGGVQGLGIQASP